MTHKTRSVIPPTSFDIVIQGLHAHYKVMGKRPTQYDTIETNLFNVSLEKLEFQFIAGNIVNAPPNFDLYEFLNDMDIVYNVPKQEPKIDRRKNKNRRYEIVNECYEHEVGSDYQPKYAPKIIYLRQLINDLAQYCIDQDGILPNFYNPRQKIGDYTIGEINNILLNMRIALEPSQFIVGHSPDSASSFDTIGFYTPKHQIPTNYPNLLLKLNILRKPKGETSYVPTSLLIRIIKEMQNSADIQSFNYHRPRREVDPKPKKEISVPVITQLYAYMKENFENVPDISPCDKPDKINKVMDAYFKDISAKKRPPAHDTGEPVPEIG